MIDYFMTNEALLQYVGKQMRQMRINAQLSQQQLADRAGVSRSTITQVENGKGIKLEPMVAMLRVLNKLELLNSFETQAMTSPLLLAKKEGKTPQRIRPHHD
jgi:transcriptional regulator with XRE-family HTH domain